jgi:hypothetical protein
MTRQLDFGAGPTLGFQAGSCFARFPWLGVAEDLSYFPVARREPASAQRLSLLLMLCWSLLASEEHPTGKLQPYIGFGPNLASGIPQ